MAVAVFTRLPLSHSCCWQFGNILMPRYVTLLKYYYVVLGSLRQSLPSLVCNYRTHNLLHRRSRYGAWTQNLSHDPPHACPTPDAADVATGNHHLRGACSPGSDYLTHGRWEVDFRRGRHGRDQPPLCLPHSIGFSGGSLDLR